MPKKKKMQKKKEGEGEGEEERRKRRRNRKKERMFREVMSLETLECVVRWVGPQVNVK